MVSSRAFAPVRRFLSEETSLVFIKFILAVISIGSAVKDWVEILVLRAAPRLTIFGFFSVVFPVDSSVGVRTVLLPPAFIFQPNIIRIH